MDDLPGPARHENRRVWKQGCDCCTRIHVLHLTDWRCCTRGGLALLLAGGAIGAAVAVLILNSEREPEYATGYDGVERAAGKTSAGE
jgi:hypothetical protein